MSTRLHLTWAELASLRQPKTWTQLLHGAAPQSFVARRLRDRMVEAETAGLIQWSESARTWGLTAKGLAVVDKKAA